jgi:hypothetical protein
MVVQAAGAFVVGAPGIGLNDICVDNLSLDVRTGPSPDDRDEGFSTHYETHHKKPDVARPKATSYHKIFL